MWERVIFRARCMHVEVLMRTKPLMCALNYVNHRGAVLRSMTAKQKKKQLPILISRIAPFITTYRTHPDWNCYLPQPTLAPNLMHTFRIVFFLSSFSFCSALAVNEQNENPVSPHSVCSHTYWCGLIKSQRRSIFLGVSLFFIWNSVQTQIFHIFVWFIWLGLLVCYFSQTSCMAVLVRF